MHYDEPKVILERIKKLEKKEINDGIDELEKNDRGISETMSCLNLFIKSIQQKF